MNGLRILSAEAPIMLKVQNSGLVENKTEPRVQEDKNISAFKQVLFVTGRNGENIRRGELEVGGEGE